MRRFRLLAVLLSGTPLWAAAPALTQVPAPAPTLAPAPAPASHFDQGRQAYRQGRYEDTLREMMLTLFEKPHDARAREYMRLAGERLIAQDLERTDRERRVLLEGYRGSLELGRRRAEIWKGRMLQAQAAANSGRWAASYDDAQRVLDENSFHSDALDVRKEAVRGLALTLGSTHKMSPKDYLIYRGLFLMADAKLEEARKTLGDAVTLSERGEVEDARLRTYMARLAPPPAPEIAAAPPTSKTPIAPPDSTSPAHVRKAPPSPARPGATTYAAGLKLAESGMFEEAIELFERTLSASPDHPQARQALLRARIAGEAAMKVRKADADRLYGLGLMLYGQGRRVEAVESWRKALALDPLHGYAGRALAHGEQELAEEKR